MSAMNEPNPPNTTEYRDITDPDEILEATDEYAGRDDNDWTPISAVQIGSRFGSWTRQCKYRRPVQPSAGPRGVCEVCKREFQLEDGKLEMHFYNVHQATVCNGSGYPPKTPPAPATAQVYAKCASCLQQKFLGERGGFHFHRFGGRGPDHNHCPGSGKTPEQAKQEVASIYAEPAATAQAELGDGDRICWLEYYYASVGRSGYRGRDGWEVSVADPGGHYQEERTQVIGFGNTIREAIDSAIKNSGERRPLRDAIKAAMGRGNTQTK